MKFFLLVILLTWFPLALPGALIPEPREIELGEGALRVDVQTAVIAPAELAVAAEIITAALQKTTGYVHRIQTPKGLRRMVLARAVTLSLIDLEQDEAYRLEITPEGATIMGGDLAGLMHGVQTFVQLLPVADKPFPRVMIPSQTIRDWPETARRIFHLDVSAHLFPTAELKVLLDWMSFHKLNELHLQLNGDAGWRMESLRFPALHEVGGVRASTPPYGDPMGSDSTQYGGYYPQASLRELVGYAEALGIDLVPCFSFATGASALIAAMPELGEAPVEVATTWEERKVSVKRDAATLEFLGQFFAEVATVFPSKYVRLEGEAGEFHAMLGKVLAKGKKELFLPGDISTTNFAIYSRPEGGELLTNPKLKAEEGLNPLREVYGLKSGETMQATLRTRYVQDAAKLQYLVFPRIAAFAEASWNGGRKKGYDEFRTEIDGMVSRYQLSGVASSFPYDLPVGVALGGTLVTSSLSGRAGHEPGLIFDGREDSFFWSKEGVKKGDHLTLRFPWPIGGDLTVATGSATGLGVLLDGVLDLSADGEEWDAAAEFFNGLAAVTVPRGTRFARIRVFGPQEEPLILNEVSLSEALLMPQHEESREVQLPQREDKITIVFKADFEKHPEFRDEIGVIRAAFFKEWLPLTARLGLAHDPATPRTFEVKPGEPGELTEAEARAWFMRRFIPRLQSYPVSAPQWFATGMSALLRDDFPKDAQVAKCLEGGAETAAFLKWVSGKFGAEALMVVSQDCRRGLYQPKVWKLATKFKLDELVLQYRVAE